MNKRIAFAIIISFLFTGCATVPLVATEESGMAKEFKSPSENNAGLYIYRSGNFGGALKKDIWVDGECIGETAPNVFFYLEVEGNMEHKISTESEFSPNDLLIYTDVGKNYFIKQYIKFGVLVGGANLKVVDEEQGKEAIMKLNMAQKGYCSKPNK